MRKFQGLKNVLCAQLLPVFHLCKSQCMRLWLNISRATGILPWSYNRNDIRSLDVFLVGVDFIHLHMCGTSSPSLLPVLVRYCTASWWSTFLRQWSRKSREQERSASWAKRVRAGLPAGLSAWSEQLVSWLSLQRGQRSTFKRWRQSYGPPRNLKEWTVVIKENSMTNALCWNELLWSREIKRTRGDQERRIHVTNSLSSFKSLLQTHRYKYFWSYRQFWSFY